MDTFLSRYKRNHAAVFGLFVVVLIIVMAITASFLYPEDPFRLVGKPLSKPLTNGFLLGSDSLGRDVASGIVHGAKTSLLIGYRNSESWLCAQPSVAGARMQRKWC